MKQFILSLFILVTFIGCGAYSFTGGNTGDAKTIQIDFFQNQAPLVEPVLTQRFTNDLQDLFTRQTNLTLTDSNGDLYFSGEITGYRIKCFSKRLENNSALYPWPSPNSKTELLAGVTAFITLLGYQLSKILLSKS